MKPTSLIAVVLVTAGVGILLSECGHPAPAPPAATAPPVRSAPPIILVPTTTPAPDPIATSAPAVHRKPSLIVRIIDRLPRIHIHPPHIPTIAPPASTDTPATPPKSGAVDRPSSVHVASGGSAIDTQPSAVTATTPLDQPPQATGAKRVGNNMFSTQRFGIAHTSLSETAVTVDILHRDVAVNPFGIRLKVGEWGAGLFVAKRLGKGSGFESGPQVNYQTGRSFVGLGYEVRNRAVVGMVGAKF